MRQAPQFVERLARDASGNVLPIAAIGLLVGAVIIGSAVDLGRNYLAKEQLQAACDAGVLAGRRTITSNGFDTASKNAAKAYFLTNYNDNAQSTRSTQFTTASDDNGNTITATASTVLDTLLMRIFGKNSFTITVTCGSSMGVGNADIMMVLDTTGSMSSSLGTTTRIAALRTAMKNFYTTMANATTGTNARVRFGFVPYSSTVNVGRLVKNLNPAYLADKQTYQSRQPFFLDYSKQSKTNSSTSYGTESLSSSSQVGSSYSTQTDCTKALPASDADYSDSGTATSVSTTPTTGGVGSTSGTSTKTITQSQQKKVYQCISSGSGSSKKYYVYKYTYTRSKITTETYSVPYSNVPTSNSTFDHWEYKPVEFDTSTFKTFSAATTYTGSQGAAVSSTWAGCIEERATKAVSSFSYSSLTGMSPSGALDIDIDSAPGTDNTTKWKPMWTQVAYTRAGSSTNTFNTATSTTGAAVTEYCPKAAQGLQEMTQSSFNTYADSLVAVGGTYLDIGMIWGGRLLSPDGIFGSLVNEEPANGGEVARHIIFMTDGEMDTAYYVQSAWGIEYFDRRVTTDGSTGDDARHTSRFLATCEAIKDKGIRVWVVAFTSSLSTDLKTCASDSSSYTANSATELNTAFQEIAKQVGELRVVQ
ncbi:pilus assembly protein TadG-related protein [Novosphingobium sp. BL-52-GroH]|uniref:pilus assembly protein TadG-related protein n=1 Tax=Novosphingobium sp. BL-52-GroH TaxID=3349877 RepID=UPI00384B0542